MRNKLSVYIYGTISILLAIGAYLLFFSDISEKRYNKIMCYYVARSLTDSSKDFYAKVVAIRDFVGENIIPLSGYYNRLDTCAVEKLTSGIGWCDQEARVFMQIARSIGITTRLLFLKDSSGASPHSIAEVLMPDRRWVIVDVAYKFDLVNENGKPASQVDIKENIDIIKNNKRVKTRAKFEERWADNAYLSIYSNMPEYVVTKSGVEVDFLRFVPRTFIRPFVAVISQRYLDKIKPDMKNAYEFEFVNARTYHLLGYYKKSAKMYDDIIANSGDLLLTRKAQFYRAILLKDEKKYGEACNYITNVISKDRENPYMKFLLGLRVRILKRMSKELEAEKDLEAVHYDLEA